MALRVGEVIEPIIASSLWTMTNDARKRQVKRRLVSGHQGIDEMLDGGFEYGENGIACISATEASNGKNLARAVLVQHMLSSNLSRATIIDAALGFDVRGLYEDVEAALCAGSLTHTDEPETLALKVLDRVQIIKVFDLAGLVEALEEVRSNLDGIDSTTTGSVCHDLGLRLPQATIPDSQDDGEEIFVEDAGRDSLRHSTTNRESTAIDQQPNSACREPGDDGTYLLIVDEFSKATKTVKKSGSASSQALIASFLRSLRHLNNAHSMSTILVDLAIEHPTLGTQKDHITPSIFSSCPLRPSLSLELQWMVDLHLMVHMIPLRKIDAEKYYVAGLSATRGQRVQMANVVEVLYDRRGIRLQKWAAFLTDEAGRLKPAI